MKMILMKRVISKYRNRRKKLQRNKRKKNKKPQQKKSIIRFKKNLEISWIVWILMAHSTNSQEIRKTKNELLIRNFMNLTLFFISHYSLVLTHNSIWTYLLFFPPLLFCFHQFYFWKAFLPYWTSCARPSQLWPVATWCTQIAHMVSRRACFAKSIVSFCRFVYLNLILVTEIWYLH